MNYVYKTFYNLERWSLKDLNYIALLPDTVIFVIIGKGGKELPIIIGDGKWCLLQAG